MNQNLNPITTFGLAVKLEFMYYIWWWIIPNEKRLWWWNIGI